MRRGQRELEVGGKSNIKPNKAARRTSEALKLARKSAQTAQRVRR